MLVTGFSSHRLHFYNFSFIASNIFAQLKIGFSRSGKAIIMKSILSILLIVICTYSKAQLKNSTNDIALVKEIDVKKYRGQAFKLSADVQTKAIDGLGLAAFMVLQVGDGMSFLEQSRKKSDQIANNQSWKTCTFEGIIEDGAIKLWLYFLTYGNGDFYLDNIRFQIKTADGTWSALPLFNGNFENSTIKSPLKGLANTESLLKKENVVATIIQEPNPDRSRVLKIQSINALPDNRIVYGLNRKAGNYIRVNGIKMYYEIYGDGEPLVLLHGNGGSINSFSAQIPAFSKHYKVIAIDTRGQGKSKDVNSTSFSYNQFADDLKVLLDSLNLKNVNLLGWSDGGNTGLILASQYPSYIKKLITMGANLNPSEDALSKKILTITKRDLNKIKLENKKEDLVTIRLMEMLLKEPNINPESLKSITAKTMIIAGEKDVILEKHTRLIAESIPHAKLNILKAQTHFVVEENPELFNQAVLEFLLNSN